MAESCMPCFDLAGENQSGVVWLKIQAEGTTPAPTPMAVNTEQTQFSIFCTGFEDKESTFPALLAQLAFF